eukprot:gene2184-2384_t
MENTNSPELVPESLLSSGGESQQTQSQPPPQQQLLMSSDLSNGRWPEYCNPTYEMPNMIDVKVQVGQETYIFPVHISKASQPKPYLGGYRHKINGILYHHATSQTPTEQQRKIRDYSNLCSRETQTVETRTLSIQNTRESGTQMERIDLHLDHHKDQILYAKTYFTSEELLIKKKAATIMIQRHWRGFMARRRAQLIRQRNIDFMKQITEEKVKREAVEAEIRIRDLARRAHPKSNADFEVLYNELDAWRQAEIQKIKATIVSPEERKVAMHDLLLNETKALQHLQQLKLAAAQEMHVEKTQLMLSNMSAPLRWQLQNGAIALVHTPETQRAKQLLELYNRFSQPVDAIDDRLDVLMKVKWEVEYDSSMEGQELVSLLDREADLLSRRRPLKTMQNLRLRSAHLFLQLVQSPDFNPRAIDFIKEKV